MDIACVEGDVRNLNKTVRALSAQGHCVKGFENAQALQQGVSQSVFDMYVVGAQLPDIGNEELVLWLRSTMGTPIPVMVLIPPEEDALMVRLLSAGADGFAASPVRTRELGARVEALLRRTYRWKQQGHRAVYGEYEFDKANCRAICAGVELDVLPRELDLAHYLFERAGWLVPRPVLEERIWGRRLETGSRVLDNMISRVRINFGLDGKHGYRLVNVYGHGIKLVPNP